MEGESTGSHAVVREEESQSAYSVLHRDTVLSKSSSQIKSFEDKYKRWNSAVTISRLSLVIMVISISFLVVSTAVAISVGVSYIMVSRLGSEISSVQSKASFDEEKLQYDLERLENNTYINSFQLSEYKKVIKSINMSILNIFSLRDGYSNDSHLQGLINISNSNLLNLIIQLTENVTLNYASLNQRINLIMNATIGECMSYPAPSCQAILTLQPHSKSGYYWVWSSNGSSIRVYCEMTKSCGNITGGLIRVAVLNNETRSCICTGEFVTVEQNTRCARNTTEPGCSHIVFTLRNISYSHICGTVESYYFGLPDGFTGGSRSPSTTINDNYVDGISLTYGNTSNRTHIWTFIADNNEPCPHNEPDYVGNNHSCLNWLIELNLLYVEEIKELKNMYFTQSYYTVKNGLLQFNVPWRLFMQPMNHVLLL